MVLQPFVGVKNFIICPDKRSEPIKWFDSLKINEIYDEKGAYKKKRIQRILLCCFSFSPERSKMIFHLYFHKFAFVAHLSYF